MGKRIKRDRWREEKEEENVDSSIILQINSLLISEYFCLSFPPLFHPFWKNAVQPITLESWGFGAPKFK